MKKAISLLVFILMNTAAFCQWTLDKNHSKFNFTVLHHGITEVDGNFKKFEGKITAAQDDLSDAVFEITIEAASINTDLEMRDASLRGEDMFNVVKFPQITFKSTSWKKLSGNKYEVAGDITIKGVTKPIKLDVTMNGPVPSPDQRSKAMQIGIKAIGTIKRSDFGVGTGLPTALVSDEIQIRATGEFNKE